MEATMKKHLYVLISLLLSSYSFATIIHIPDDQPTIQNGISVAIDGDTVLVQPGTYLENINYSGKNITVASLYLTTQDTSYISQTIVEYGSWGSYVVNFSNGEDTTALLCGFTIEDGHGGISCYSSNPTLQNLVITNNFHSNWGGGIYLNNSSPALNNLLISDNVAWNGSTQYTYGGGIACFNGSHPTLHNVTISNNSSRLGGGMYCENSDAILNNVTISNNFANSHGGGIYCTSSNTIMQNVTIEYNSSYSGGGIYCSNSNPVLQDVILSENSSGSGGGGLYCEDGSIPELNDVTILNNSAGSGGGLYCIDGSNPILQNVTIFFNSANSGGGIYCHSSIPIFDSTNRSNIYFNSASQGNDMYSDTLLEVIVDTFTVLYPTDYHAYPTENFSFDILNGKVEQVEADLYVSPEGDNSNSGLTADDPIKNIWIAFIKILADSLDPHTIHLLEGTYSSSESEEIFPINLLDYISLSGESQNNVILDAEGQSNVLNLDNITGSSIMHLTITGGAAANGGGIVCNYSNVSFQNLTINNNAATAVGGNIPHKGGGIYCNNSNITMQEMSINNNSADHGGGIYYSGGSGSVLNNVTISNNSAVMGGGVFFSNSVPVSEGLIIMNNAASQEGGGIYSSLSNLQLTNVFISNNSACSGGGIFFNSSDCKLENTSITYNTVTSDGGGIYCSSSIPVFDSIDRCNIFLNSALQGNDLYSDIFLDVVVDTFTVLYPTEFHADPLENFSFDILNCKIEQVDADLYVSPDGDDSNSGLSVNDPLKTIRFAFSKFLTNSQNQNTIHLLEGIYSPSTNEELFPLYLPDYYILAGESDSTVILDAEELSNLLIFDYNTGTTVSGLTITGGSAEKGGGIYCHYSDPDLHHLTLLNNSADYGAGICCEFAVPHLQDVTISNNTSPGNGGGIYCANSYPDIQDVILTENSATLGGAVCCNWSSISIQNASIINNSASLGGAFYCNYNSTPEIINTTLSGNSASSHGGAIYCENSYTHLQDLIIINNTTQGNGGGIYFNNAEADLEDLTIAGNIASAEGGGMYCNNSNLELIDADIESNTALYGGAIYIIDSYLPVLHGIAMSENTADNGGGIYCQNSSPDLKNVTINNNAATGNESLGGGILCTSNSNPSLEFVTINNNSATNGGGIYCSSSYIAFNEINRCNIYFNDAVRGNDLYSDTLIEVVVDTFTVMYPHEYFAEPFGNFSFDILNGKIEQVNADLYISPDGDNMNSGLTAEDPLKTLKYAFSIIRADNLNPKTVHLLEGIYSSSTNEETMPVNIIDYVNIIGVSESNVVMDGENLSALFEYHNNHLSIISDLTLKNGNGLGISIINSDLELQNITISNNTGHGISIIDSDLELQNITTSNNTGHGMYGQNSNLGIDNTEVIQNGGSGIYCENTNIGIENSILKLNNGYGIYCHTADSLVMEYLTISENGDRGIFMFYASYSNIIDVIIEENNGGGIRLGFSDPVITDVIISNNSAINGGGLYCSNNSNPYLENVYITNNSVSGTGGGIYCSYISDPILTNVQITGNTAEDNGGGLVILGQCNPMLINTTIADNSSIGAGGAVYCHPNANPVIVNSILWNNLPHEIYGNTLDVQYTNVQGGWEGEGNIDADPLFTGSGDYPFALSDDSPCINAGNPDTTGLNLPEFDLAGNQRLRGARIDMGAFENQSVSTFIQNSQSNNFDLLCTPKAHPIWLLIKKTSRRSRSISYCTSQL